MKFFKKEHGLSINKLYPCFIRSEVSKEGLFFYSRQCIFAISLFSPLGQRWCTCTSFEQT